MALRNRELHARNDDDDDSWLGYLTRKVTYEMTWDIKPYYTYI